MVAAGRAGRSGNESIQSRIQSGEGLAQPLRSLAAIDFGPIGRESGKPQFYGSHRGIDVAT